MQVSCQVLRKNFGLYHFREGKIYLEIPDDHSLTKEEQKEVVKMLNMPTVLISLVVGYLNAVVYNFTPEQAKFLADFTVNEETRERKDLQKYTISISPDDRYVCVAQKCGVRAQLVDLVEQKIVASITRDDYCAEVTPFPHAFVEVAGSTKFLFSSKWNVLQLWDVATWMLEKEEDMGDFFNSTLLPSPSTQHVINAGWCWHPVFVPHIIDVKTWLNPSGLVDKKTFIGPNICDEGTEYPICWIDNERYAVYRDRLSSPSISVYRGKELLKFITLPENEYSRYSRLCWDDKSQLLLFSYLDWNEKTETDVQKVLPLDIAAGKCGVVHSVSVVATHPTSGIIVFDGEKFKTWNIPPEELHVV